MEYREGGAFFRDALDSAGVIGEPEVEWLLEWADALDAAGLARLRSTIGSHSRALRIELPDEGVSLVTFWRIRRGISVALEGPVLRRRAADASARIERRLHPKKLSAGSNYPSRPYNLALFDDLTAAYREAAGAS